MVRLFSLSMVMFIKSNLVWNIKTWLKKLLTFKVGNIKYRDKSQEFVELWIWNLIYLY